MAKVAAPIPAPPIEVIDEFLGSLAQTVNFGDRLVPVLRGSVLMKRWFGDAARPAVDVDLEWFPQPGFELRRASVIDVAHRLSMFAVGYFNNAAIIFDQNMSLPGDGVSLWEYETPGVRCYSGWTWANRNLSGLLQVDLAQAGAYDLSGVVAETIELPRATGKPATILAYAPEMLLAAKLSWIVRHLERDAAEDGSGLVVFLGEPKDLFDAHLLLTSGNLRSDAFGNAWLAVAMEDKLDWRRIDFVLDDGLAIKEEGLSSNWKDFLDRHRTQVRDSPGQMLRTVIDRVRPLLDEVRRHLPFLHAIQADPVDEANCLIYADWLEDRADPRAEFLRLYGRFFFHDDRSVRAVLAASLPTQPGGWLYHVFGSPQRARDLRKRIEAT